MKMWEMEEKRDRHLQQLITKYGFEAEPTLFYSKYSKDIYNESIYFMIAMNWKFKED